MWEDPKTTIIGLITAAAGFIVLKPEHFASMPLVIDVAEYALLGGLAGLGIAAKQTPGSVLAKVNPFKKAVPSD